MWTQKICLICIYILRNYAFQISNEALFLAFLQPVANRLKSFILPSNRMGKTSSASTFRNHPPPPTYHTNSKLHDREDIEQYSESRSCQSSWINPQKLFGSHPNFKKQCEWVQNNSKLPPKTKNLTKCKLSFYLSKSQKTFRARTPKIPLQGQLGVKKTSISNKSRIKKETKKY